jgi:methyl-accepting chemotaxis protein
MQLPADKINSIMARRDGLGKLGETYLVGPDGRMRSDSVLDPESFSVLASFRQGEGHVRSPAITAASEGRSGTARARNYLGSRVISAYAPFEGPGDRAWAFVAEIDEDEALEDLHRIERRMQVTTVVMMVLVCVGAYILAKRIERPVRASARELHETSDQVKQASSEVSVSPPRRWPRERPNRPPPSKRFRRRSRSCCP